MFIENYIYLVHICNTELGTFYDTNNNKIVCLWGALVRK